VRGERRQAARRANGRAARGRKSAAGRASSALTHLDLNARPARAIISSLGLFHHLPRAQPHFIKFPAQAFQPQLLQDGGRPLHSLGNLLREALCLPHHPARRNQQLAIALLQLVLINRAFGPRHPTDLQQPQLHTPAPVAQLGSDHTRDLCNLTHDASQHPNAATVGVFAYAVVTFAVKIKSRFIGIIVPAFLLVTLAVMVISLLHRWRKQSDRAPAIAAAILCVLALASFSSPAFRAWRTHMDPITANTRHTVLQQIVDALASDLQLQHKTVYRPVIATSANPDTVTFELYARRRPPPAWQQFYWTTDAETHRKAVDQSDYAILFSPDYSQASNMPTSHAIEQINRIVTDGGSFELMARIEDPWAKGYVTIWRRP
jgi:hypothetical protein